MWLVFTAVAVITGVRDGIRLALSVIVVTCVFTVLSVIAVIAGGVGIARSVVAVITSASAVRFALFYR